jgi:hypothetical protein
MATIDLNEAWVHLATDLATYVRLPIRDLEATPTRRVEAREYASGRVRRVSQPTRVTSVTVRSRLVDRATVATLDGWTGETVMLRDARGRKLWGFYRYLDIIEHAWTDRADVVFELLSITHDEAV